MTGWSGRRILGNLLFEEELAAKPVTPSRSALATAAGAATLLRAFASDGDRLWTPAPVAPERLVPLPYLPIPELESGPLERLPPVDEVLAWGETPAVAAHRLRRPPAPLPDLEAPLHELLWRVPPAPPTVVAAVHHRAFCLEVARSLHRALPGARMVSSPAELEGEAGNWVLKAPLSAAGRSRYRHPAGESLAEPAVRRRIERLFEHHGPLLFEPWMERTDDFGCVAVVTPDGLRLAGFHRLLVDGRGQFTGIELAPTFQGFDGLTGEERAAMEEALDATARALRQAGYSGPFGVDAWRYRGPHLRDGGTLFHPLGEINARLTFGLVARVLLDRWVDRWRGLLGLLPGHRIRLVLGRRTPGGSLPLLVDTEETSGAAWLIAKSF